MNVKVNSRSAYQQDNYDYILINFRDFQIRTNNVHTLTCVGFSFHDSGIFAKIPIVVTLENFQSYNIVRWTILNHSTNEAHMDNVHVTYNQHMLWISYS